MASRPMRTPSTSTPARNANTALNMGKTTSSSSRGCAVRTGFRDGTAPTTSWPRAKATSRLCAAFPRSTPIYNNVELSVGASPKNQISQSPVDRCAEIKLAGISFLMKWIPLNITATSLTLALPRGFFTYQPARLIGKCQADFRGDRSGQMPDTKKPRRP
jgi:hypothetical protein